MIHAMIFVPSPECFARETFALPCPRFRETCHGQT